MVLDAPDTRTRRRTARHRRRTDEQTIILVPDTGGESIPLPEPTVVGRDPRNISAYPQAQRVSIFDPSRSVSKTHALLVPVPGGVWVTDLHSTNGTRLRLQVQAGGDRRPFECVFGGVVAAGIAQVKLAFGARHGHEVQANAFVIAIREFADLF